MKSTFLNALMLTLALVGPAAAQRSLFDQPIQNPSDGGASPPATAPAPAPVPASEAAPARQVETPAPTAPQAEGSEAGERQATPRRKAKPRKPRGPVPARALAIFNGSPTTLVALEVSQDGRGARLKKPLAAGKRTRLALPAFKSCEVSVSATFEGHPAGAASQVDICKEKSLNFRD